MGTAPDTTIKEYAEETPPIGPVVPAPEQAPEDKTEEVKNG
jgi:hypothetical protein